MSEQPINSQLPLEEKAEKLGKRAMALGLIPSFVVRYFPDVWQFYIPNEKESEPLTPEQAYFRLKKIVDESSAAQQK